MMNKSVSIGLVAAGTFAAVAAFSLGDGNAHAQDAAGASGVIKDGKIGFVLTSRYWAVHQTPEGKVECPNGYNDGPREQFTQLFPNDGTKRTLLETQLMREGRQWLPTTAEEPFTFKEAGGKIAHGMDLDGKVKATDFTSPDGAKGIDNQLFRAIGCISNYRAPEGTIYHFENEYVGRYVLNRFMIEITGVDSLTNDDSVTINSYRGIDPIMADATGANFIPGGTQRVDNRWGNFVRATWQAKIVDGVLISAPSDVEVPHSATFDTNGLHRFKGLRFQLKLTPDRAEGVMAGYVDVEAFNHHLNTSWSTHHQSYGQLSAPSLYRALRRLADGYPDPVTGEMTAISSAQLVKFIRTNIEHPPRVTAVDGSAAPGVQTSRE
ncbi:MAG: hypothetical protein AB7E79_06870 [Rhodospirillaceae bacterium]